MKRIFFVSLMLGISAWVSAQCTPDTNCIDINEPGQICPDTLEGAILGESYEQTMTFISPDTVMLNNTKIAIAKIVLDTIGNLPPGITYSYDTNVFFPDTMYCVLFSGTPTDTGTYHLAITVTPYVYFYNQILAGDPVKDDTSLFITVSVASAVTERMETGFSLIRPYPNPFSESTSVGFTMRDPGKAELIIYNLIGKIMVRELLIGHPGKNYFRFTGVDLPAGIYPYFIIAGNKRGAGKLVKVK